MKKTVAFEADKVRNLKFGMNAMIQLEKELGKPLSSLGADEFKLGDLRTMLFVGLKWEDKDLSLETVGEIMDEAIDKHGIEYLSEKIGEAMQGAFGNTAMPTAK